MHKVFLLTSFLVMALTACVQQQVGYADPTELSKDQSEYAFGEKCKNAKEQFDKSVAEGQKSDLRELKQNIELHCVWRRN